MPTGACNINDKEMTFEWRQEKMMRKCRMENVVTCLGTRMHRMPGIFWMRMFLTQAGIRWVLGFL